MPAERPISINERSAGVEEAVGKRIAFLSREISGFVADQFGEDVDLSDPTINAIEVKFLPRPEATPVTITIGQTDIFAREGVAQCDEITIDYGGEEIYMMGINGTGEVGLRRFVSNHPKELRKGGRGEPKRNAFRVPDELREMNLMDTFRINKLLREARHGGIVESARLHTRKPATYLGQSARRIHADTLSKIA